MGDRAFQRHVVIFVRRPQYGRGKRRLAAELGELAAWRFQRFAIAKLMRTLAPDPRWRTWLAVTPDRPTDWVCVGTPTPQGPGDLGERLERVMRGLPKGPVVVIGSDAPQILRADIAGAFRQLGGSDAVFGPATDGGYWLVGLSHRGRLRPPFCRVRWSTSHALADTIANLKGGTVRMLRVLEDVDDASSFYRFRDRAYGHAFQGPNTGGASSEGPVDRRSAAA